jgi:transposase-like protein
MLPQLYLHGLSSGDFELAMRGLLGDGAPLSASSIARLRDSWTAEFITWKQRSLKDKEIVYLWVDGIYVKAGLEKDKAALLVVIGALSDGTKEVLAVECGQRESEASWSSILRDLKARGMSAPRLVMGDGHHPQAGTRDMVGACQCLSGRFGAAVLEPSDAQCARLRGQKAPGRGQGTVAKGDVRGHP